MMFRLKPLASALLTLSAPTVLLSAPAAMAADAEVPATELAPVKVTAETGSAYAAPRTTTATKTDTAVRDVPQSITVVTQQQMQDQSVQNIGDAVRYVPGVSMAQGEGNRETPIIRGVTSTGDFFLDGVRDDVQYYRDLYNIERVEVLKGPNAMIFGRGGVGGLINRVTRVADWQPVRELTLQAGSDDNRRASFDVGQGLNERFAARLTGVYEDSESYRDDVTLERKAVNPTLAWRAGSDTLVTLGYEYFKDERVADRGVPSLNGRPVATDPSTFFGDPGRSPTHTEVQMGNALIEHAFSNGVSLRNRTRFADYDKFYQNIFPGAVTVPQAGEPTVSLSAYSNATTRENLFNQTDLVYELKTGAVTHTLLGGVELGRQETDNRRLTGYFDAAFTQETRSVPLRDPRSDVDLFWKAKSGDADNAGTTKVAAAYVQDQLQFTPQLQLVAGVRVERFEVDFTDRRASVAAENRKIDSADTLVSPRAGLVYKPREPLSIYASYSIAYQPRAGDQLASLTLNNKNLDPEQFTNIEVGAKFDISTKLAATAAVYQLDREDQAVADPNDATALILVDGQRTRGIELALAGNLTEQWSVIGGYAYQDAEILSDQSATIREGARLGQVPKHTVSLWNRYDLTPMWGLGLGIVRRSDMFATTQNTVTPASNVELDAYTRVDGALFFTLNPSLSAQLNVENLFDEAYYANAHNNNNIQPGSPRAARVSLRARF